MFENLNSVSDNNHNLHLQALVVIGLIKKGILEPNFKIGSSLQFWHNMFLAGQSAGLIVVCAYLYMDTAEKTNLHPFWDISKVNLQSKIS
jgi:hypothetical protein